MLRTPLKQCYKKTLLVSKNCSVPCRAQSSSSGGSGAGKALVAVGATAAVIGGTIGYAKYDTAFRNTLEDNVPYSDVALKYVIGEKSPGAGSAPSATKSTTLNVGEKSRSQPAPPIRVEPSLLQKRLDREEQKSPEATKETPLSTEKTDVKTVSKVLPPSVPAPQIEKPETQKQVVEPIDVEKAEPNLSNSALVGDSSRTKKRQEELTSLAGKPVELRRKPETSENLNNIEPDVLREQLKLQLAAYTDYLKEQLHLQRQELNREHAIIMEERLLQEKLRYQQELVASISRLQEIERVLSVREKLDASEHKSRELWLVCQILNDALKSNPSDSVELAPRNILNEVQSIIKKVNESESNPLSQLALRSLPKAALEDGVYTEDALVARFDKIDRIARRVSLIGDDGGSLWRYMLSYLQSVLIIEGEPKPSRVELEDKEFNAASLDTFDILKRVKYHLKQRNLEMSLRYANQLRGEPRKVANDWIRDVRIHLETRQAANILLAQAASVSIRTLKN